MRKRVLIFLSLTAAFVYLAAYTTSWSQSFFNNNTEDKKTAPPKPGALSPVVSPMDFKNKVNSMSQKNQEGLNQDALQRLKKPPVLGPTPVTPSLLPKPTENKPAVTTSEPITGTLPVSAPPSQPQAPINETETESTQPPSPTTTPPTLQSTPSSSVYTGFGGDKTNQNNTTTQPSNTSGSGWNVKY